MGCCPSDIEVSESLFEAVELYLNKYQLMDVRKMKKKSKEIISYIYLKSKLDILGSIVKDIENFDRIPDPRKRHRGAGHLEAGETIADGERIPDQVFVRLVPHADIDRGSIPILAVHDIHAVHDIDAVHDERPGAAGRGLGMQTDGEEGNESGALNRHADLPTGILQ